MALYKKGKDAKFADTVGEDDVFEPSPDLCDTNGNLPIHTCVFSMNGASCSSINHKIVPVDRDGIPGRFDEYGFRCENSEPFSSDETPKTQSESSQNRLRWIAHLEFAHDDIEGELTWDKIDISKITNCKLNDMVKAEGIPHSMRPFLWPRLIGATKKRQNAVFQYSKAVAQADTDKPCIGIQIEKDLLRTIPNNICFSNEQSPGIEALRRVLKAVAYLYPDLGYCQGMGVIVASLLLVCSEENTFWIMCALIEDILPSNYYSHSLLGLQADDRVARHLLRVHIPDIDQKLTENDVELSLISVNWLLTLLASAFPMPVLLRVWDMLFVFGGVTIFRVILSMLKLHEQDVLDVSTADGASAELFNVLAQIPSQVERVDHLVEMMTTFEFSITEDLISQLRKKYQAVLMADRGAIINTNIPTNLPKQRLNRRKLTRSKSIIQQILPSREESEENDPKLKNVRQTEHLVDLKNAVYQICQYFISCDENLAKTVVTQANYTLDQEENDRHVFVNAQKSGFKRARALLDFQRQEEDELGFRKNDIILVIDEKDEHCWVGEVNGLRGWFPAKFVEIVDDRGKKYSVYGDEAINSEVTELIRGQLAITFKQILEHGLRHSMYSFALHPWLFIEEIAKSSVQCHFSAVNSRLTLCDTFKLDQDRKILTPEELLYRAVQEINESHSGSKALMDVKVRSLVVYAVNEQCLHLWLELMCKNPMQDVIRKQYYHSDSFIRSPAWMQIKCELRLLTQFSFSLDVDYEISSTEKAKKKCANALQQIDEFIGSRASKSASSADVTASLINNNMSDFSANVEQSAVREAMEPKQSVCDSLTDSEASNCFENGNTEKQFANFSWNSAVANWNGRGREECDGNDASDVSGGESPPSDIRVLSPLTPPVPSLNIFVKAIEDDQFEKPDLETQLKIITWLSRFTEKHMFLRSRLYYLCDDLCSSLNIPQLPSGNSELRGMSSIPDHLNRGAPDFRIADHRAAFPSKVMSHDSIAALKNSESGSILRESRNSIIRSTSTSASSSRPVVPYVTHYSDSGFSSGSSCSQLPPPPPYRIRPGTTGGDSKYGNSQLSLHMGVTPFAQDNLRSNRVNSWTSRISLSPSPSMSTVSCPEYPEIPEKFQRLAMARDSLSLQVSVLTEQVGAQREKISDLESLLAAKRSKLDSTEELIHDRPNECGHLESQKLGLMAEVSNLKLMYATMEREKNETERKLRLSQTEVERLTQSMHNVLAQGLHLNTQGQFNTHAVQSCHGTSEPQDEMEKLRLTVQKLIADNEQKNMEINTLRSALDEQAKEREMEKYSSTMEMRNSPSFPLARHGTYDKNQPFDINAQIRKLLTEDTLDPIAHSSSYPTSLCNVPQMHLSTRSPAQMPSSSSYTSSLSAASPQHSSWSSTSGTPRHLIKPHSNYYMMGTVPCSSASPGPSSYRSPSSPAARQLAAELDELRRIGGELQMQQQINSSYNCNSLPRSVNTKRESSNALQKISIASSGISGEYRPSATPSVISGSSRKPPSAGRSYKVHINRWIQEKFRSDRQRRSNKRSTSAPNLAESDDELTRGRQQSTGASTERFRRGRTRSTIRNLLGKFSRSNSQENRLGEFRRNSNIRSSASARLVGPVSGAMPRRPQVQLFVDFTTDQVCEWMAEIGFTAYVPEVERCVRSGRHLLNMSQLELEKDLLIRNPFHRKRLLLFLHSIEQPRNDVSEIMDTYQVVRWLDEIGLPQYKEVFTENMIEGPLLVTLTAAELVEMKITSALQHAAVARGIAFLHNISFLPHRLERKFDADLIQKCPIANEVEKWSQQCVVEWLKTIDLGEFTPNLNCAGIHGALMVNEPTFTAESLAEVLQIPAHKTLLRRHLTTHFNNLLGPRIVSHKREVLAQPLVTFLTPLLKIKLVKKGFSITRKKTKNEVLVEPDEPVDPVYRRHMLPKPDCSLDGLASSDV
ncbi:hypothetical protein QR680_002140 [Steinernema hermaphroditum]|uniref:RUN and TBC1 domain-containing protein 3 n=1 Tax=Steinernema hermaphroditum TaxID=289476 RepID=A0AA39LHP3_9BILA|nr:hypothetical protein QR680_002140 [Steinernema hermaphroditum]